MNPANQITLIRHTGPNGTVWTWAYEAPIDPEGLPLYRRSSIEWNGPELALEAALKHDKKRTR